jgi:tryptophanyl-tRNA synthetase
MTQFKDKKGGKEEEGIGAGLFTYPVLMAADILLFQTHLVPVGDDQRQHVELARDVAQRFNGVYGDVFVIPEGYIPPVGARIMALQDPDKKMSKSDENINNSIFLSDTSDAIMKKFKRAVTDSDGEVRFAPEEKAGVSNLLSIYSCVTGRTPADCEKDFAGQGYGALKTTVAQAVIEALTPFSNEHARLIADTAYLDGIIAKGASQAKALATSTMARVKDAVGLPK